MPGLGNVVPIASDLRRQRQLVVRQKRLEVFLRRDERHVRPHEADGQEERLAGVLFDQLHGLGRGLAVGVNQVIAVGFDHDERVAAHDRLLAIRIAFQRLADAARLPFRAGAVESLGPRSRVIRAVAAVVVAPVAPFLDAARHAHVIDLADAGRVVAGILEVLRPRRAVADRRPRAGVSQHAGRVRIVARQERRPRRPAIRPLAKRPRESRAPAPPADRCSASGRSCCRSTTAPSPSDHPR